MRVHGMRSRKLSAQGRPVTARLTLELPMPHNVANGRLHWRSKHRIKQQYWILCDMLLSDRDIPAPPATPFVRSRCTITLKLCGRTMDRDNAYARVKFPVDWLKSRGYIVDDNERAFDLTVRQERVPSRGLVGLVVDLEELTVEEAA